MREPVYLSRPGSRGSAPVRGAAGGPVRVADQVEDVRRHAPPEHTDPEPPERT